MTKPVSAQRQRMIDDMKIRNISPNTQFGRPRAGGRSTAGSIDDDAYVARVLPRKSNKLNNRFYQPHAVLSHCRMLHTLRLGAVESKRAGAAWATQALDSSWGDLIQQALDDRPGDASIKVRQDADAVALSALGSSCNTPLISANKGKMAVASNANAKPCRLPRSGLVQHLYCDTNS